MEPHPDSQCPHPQHEDNSVPSTIPPALDLHHEHQDGYARSVSSEDSPTAPLTPPHAYLTPMSSYHTPRPPNPDDDSSLLHPRDGESLLRGLSGPGTRDDDDSLLHPRDGDSLLRALGESVTSLPLGPLITADGRTLPPPSDNYLAQKPLPAADSPPQEQMSPSRFYEPFPEGSLPMDQHPVPFLPRREFVPSIYAPREFALLTLGEAGTVRAVGFGDDVVDALRTLLNGAAGGVGQGKAAIRERRGKELEQRAKRRGSLDSSRSSSDSPRSAGSGGGASLRGGTPALVDGAGPGTATPVEGEAVEWVLESKPWRERKLSSELLLTQILSLLLLHGYSYITPLHPPTPSSHLTFSGIFSRPLEPRSLERKQAFSVAFPAKGVVRVLGVPREGMPGVLGVVREGWGRRLKEEKMIGEGVWEGKMKGSGLFGTPAEPPGAEMILDTLTAFSRIGVGMMTIVRVAGTEMWVFGCPAGKEAVGMQGDGMTQPSGGLQVNGVM